MPRSQHDEDLFADSTMTFGEHLEELRRCLYNALVGLAVGFLFGLLVGAQVVELINKPLTEALTGYYQDRSVKRVEERLAQMQGPDDLPVPSGAKDLVEKEGLLFEEVYLDPNELIEELRAKYPNRFAPLEPDAPPEPENPAETDEAADDKPAKSEAAPTREDLLRVTMWRPIEDDARIQPKTLNAHEAFVIYIKASLLVGALLASPWIFYQIWSFVAAGLYPHEKQYIHVFLPISLGLFLAGAAVAFFFVFEPVLEFLFGFNSWLGIDPDPRISEWLGFVLMLPLGFGISFQLPLVMLFLERIGIFTVDAYISRWRVAILVIFVIAMFLTPADPTSMMLMAAPLTALYFGGIVLCRYMPRAKSPYDDLDEE
jgi:sec-independent protein translocase protein TatC